MIYYQCRECGCKFGISESDVKESEKLGIYITCPMDGRHDEMKLIKDLMEEKKAVQM